MPNRLDRRTWLQVLGALAVSPAAGQNPQSSEPPDKITREALHQALSVAGLEFTEAQETAMLSGVNRNLASYENLRKLNVPLDTEPATRFYPTAPQGAAGKFQPTRVRAGKAPANIEDLAFAPDYGDRSAAEG